MKNYIKGIVVILMLLCVVSFVHAQSFSATIEPVFENAAKIYKDEVAEFNLVINNADVNKDKYIIYSLDPSWIIYTEENQISVEGNTEKEFTLYVDPTSVIVKSGMYSLNLAVKSTFDDEIISLRKEILIKSDMHRQFQPAVSAFVFIGDEGSVNPNEPVPVKIRLVNRNALDIEKLTVFVRSSFFEDSYSVALSPNSELIKTLSFPINRFTEPQEDTLTVQVYYDGKMISDKRVTYEIKEINEFFERDSEEDKKFLYSDYTVELTNVGNVPKTEIFTYEMSWFENLFTEKPVGAEFIQEETSYLAFEVELQPNESKTINFTTNYRPTFFTILISVIVISLLFFLYYSFRSPVIVTKKASIVAEKDGGTSEIKILLNIRNRTNKVLENITVVDRIPDITEIEEEFTLGTLKPNKIVRSPKKGTLIRWDFPSVDGFEERLITYKIHSKLGILGSFSLPPTLVKFDLPNGRTRAVRSRAVEKKD